MFRIIGIFDKEVGQLANELGKHKDATSEKAQRMLGWTPIPTVDSMVATAESLAALGLLKS